MARALPELAPKSMQLKAIEIGELPHYNQDLETDSPPPAWTAFRNEVIASDALLFVTPEYNRSIPGVLKNAIDVGSRPWGKSAWNGKPTAIISASPGSLGAMASNHHLRHVLHVLNVPVLAAPEAYIANVATLFDESGQLKNEDVRKFLAVVLEAFEVWIGKLRAG
jgi:chromate reductase